MLLEWVQTLGPILVSWPVVGLIAIVVFRQPIITLAAKIQRLRVGSFFELDQTVQEVKEQQDRQEEEIKAIQLALKGILTKHETGPLEGLNQPNPFYIRYEPDLYRYLHRLDGLNFIQPHKGYGLINIEERHKDDEKLPYDQRPLFDLKKFVYITDDGKIYLDVLKSILKNVDKDSHRKDKKNLYT